MFLEPNFLNYISIIRPLLFHKQYRYFKYNYKYSSYFLNHIVRYVTTNLYYNLNAFELIKFKISF